MNEIYFILFCYHSTKLNCIYSLPFRLIILEYYRDPTPTEWNGFKWIPFTNESAQYAILDLPPKFKIFIIFKLISFRYHTEMIYNDMNYFCCFIFIKKIFQFVQVEDCLYFYFYSSMIQIKLLLFRKYFSYKNLLFILSIKNEIIQNKLFIGKQLVVYIGR